MSVPQPASPLPPQTSTAANAPVQSARDGRWWSNRRAIALLLASGVAVLETLPVALGLEVWASLGGRGPGDAVLPLWFLLLVMLGAQAVGHGLRHQTSSAAVLLALPLLLVAVLLGLVVSPLAYAGIAGGGGEPLSFNWLGALAHDLLTGSGRLNAIFGMTAVLCYVWWRGLRNGQRGLPTLDALIVLFKFSFAAVILELILAVVARGAAQAQLEGRIALLLPLEVFVALCSLSLSRSHSRPAGSVSLGWVNQPDERPWLSLALLLAAGIVGAALLLSVLLSYHNLQAALVAMGPVGAALGAGISWLLFAFAYLLYLIFGIPIAYIKSLATHAYHFSIPRPPPPPRGSCSNPRCVPTVPMSQGIYVAIFLGFVILALIALAAFLVYRTLRALRSRLPLDEGWDTPESLGRRSGKGLLAGLRRRAPAATDDGPTEAVRRVYHQVLRAAASAGIGRAAPETPDEYARRLSPAISESGAEAEAAGVATLTAAYDQVRYGDATLAEADQQRTQQQGRAVIEGLRRLHREPGAAQGRRKQH